LPITLRVLSARRPWRIEQQAERIKLLINDGQRLSRELHIR